MSEKGVWAQQLKTVILLIKKINFVGNKKRTMFEHTYMDNGLAN
jgi:hypothetical protein